MYQNKEIQIIVAVDENDGIGYNNALPWPPAKEDLKWFKQKTKNNIIIMGRKTKESLPEYPLPDRENVVISTNTPNGLLGGFSNIRHTGIFNSLDRALDALLSYPGFKDKEFFIIGGAQLYRTALDMGIVDKIWMTILNQQCTCDTFFPTLKSRWETHPQERTDEFTRILLTPCI